MMDNCCAPQWADFTRSPIIFSDDYFEIEHEVHKPQMYFKYSSNLSPCKQENRSEQSINETKFDDSLEPETGIPVCSSVAYFIPHDKKHAVVQTTNDELRRELKLDKKATKIHQTWSVSITELTSAFKVTPAQQKIKRTVSKKIRKEVKSEAKSSLRDARVNDVKKTNNPQTAFVKNKHESAMKSKLDVCSKDNPSNRRLSYKIVRAQHNALNTKQYPVGKPKVLTCQYRRTSLIKKRRCSNQFVSLAEAISKFQTETPERFRTLSNRTMKPGLLMKLKQQPLKLTYPVSPALRCKQRKRTTNTLNQQEREKLELENMKKHQIKANPVPVNILKGPTLLKKVPKKPATITEEFHLTESKKTHHTTDSSVNLQQNINAKEHQKAVFTSRSTSSSSVSCKKANSFESEVRAAMRVEFELRNKEFQLKKQEKLRNLCIQESDKIKTQFHARPAPKFSKSTSAVKDQKQFSLEERNRFIAKKDKNCPGPVKQFERLGTTKILNTNSVPCFIRGSEKENIRNKEYSFKALGTRQTKSFSDRGNKQPRIMNNTIACISTKKQTVNQQTVNRDKLQNEIYIPFKDIKNKEINDAQNKIDKLKTNIKKKIQELNEVDDIIKKREQEFKAKKLQKEKCRLLEQKMEKLKLRKMTEVKAKPMPVYKPMVIAKSTKPVTNPLSPALGIRNKAKSVC
ncbi:hypothetical protein WN51_12772 [Melipona quadrifasciata]|uniref:TPX2 central domain-containing protein n=1 Tax=Melipona quadrifasciata TaxID=166423 RepID=A0A0M9A463_9HYME|nr:hypothetical protein WN51_12772 [Melipona quadrifasciata]